MVSKFMKKVYFSKILFNQGKWTNLPSNVFANVMVTFEEARLRKLALVCKSWCHEIAMVLNARKMIPENSEAAKEASPKTKSCVMDLTGEETSKSKLNKKINVVPNCFLKDAKEDIINLSIEADVVDLCAGKFPYNFPRT